MLNTFSNTTDNFIVVQATGYLTDSPSAEENNAFQVALRASFGGINVSAVYANVVARNGTERPIILVNRTDIISGSYGVGYEVHCRGYFIWLFPHLDQPTVAQFSSVMPIIPMRNVSMLN